MLKHEFDHIRQDLAGSKLVGNESEVDAWTSSFIRDFHRTYLLNDAGATYYINSTSTFTQLLDYYRKTDVSDNRRDDCVKRIKDSYRVTLSPHEGHKHAFLFWLHRSMKEVSVTPHLAERLNTELSLGVNTQDDLSKTRQFPCGNLKTLSYSAFTLDKPSLPVSTPTPPQTH